MIGRPALIVVLLAAAVHSAAAQEVSSIGIRPIDLATVAFAGAATADWVTTYRLDTRGGREDNPLINWMQPRSPAGMVALGVAIDAGGVWAWRRAVRRRHPTIATIGLLAASSFRVYLAVRNDQRLQARRQPSRSGS